MKKEKIKAYFKAHEDKIVEVSNIALGITGTLLIAGCYIYRKGFNAGTGYGAVAMLNWANAKAPEAKLSVLAEEFAKNNK